MTEKTRFLLVCCILVATYAVMTVAYLYLGLDPDGDWDRAVWNAALDTRKAIAAGICAVAVTAVAWVLFREE